MKANHPNHKIDPGMLTDEGSAWWNSQKRKTATVTRLALEDYHMTHRAPDPDENAPMYDLTGGGLIYPEDVYSANGARIYGNGESVTESWSVAVSVRGNPNASVTIYRGAPADVTTINPGDWVTPSKAYAELHVRSNVPGGHVISTTVRAKDLWTNGDSLNEWGYAPQ